MGRRAGFKAGSYYFEQGRLTLPAGFGGLCRTAVHIAKIWVRTRSMGAPIGNMSPGAVKIANMAASTFRAKKRPPITPPLWWIRAAGHSLERLWPVVLLGGLPGKWWTISCSYRGGRGYETGPSLRKRGEKGLPVERMMR